MGDQWFIKYEENITNTECKYRDFITQGSKGWTGLFYCSKVGRSHDCRRDLCPLNVGMTLKIVKRSEIIKETISRLVCMYCGRITDIEDVNHNDNFFCEHCDAEFYIDEEEE